MQGLDELIGSSGMDLGTLGARFGLSEEQTRAAMGSLMPAVAGGFQKRAEAGDIETVAAVAPQGAPDADAGNRVLGEIFGSKDVSREVASQAAGQSGVSSTILKAMLPIVAGIVAQQLAKKMGGGGGGGGLGGALGGGLGGGLGGALGGALAGGGAGGGLGGILGSILGGGQRQESGDGGGAAGRNPLDDILGKLGGMGR